MDRACRECKTGGREAQERWLLFTQVTDDGGLGGEWWWGWRTQRAQDAFRRYCQSHPWGEDHLLATSPSADTHNGSFCGQNLTLTSLNRTAIHHTTPTIYTDTHTHTVDRIVSLQNSCPLESPNLTLCVNSVFADVIS